MTTIKRIQFISLILLSYGIHEIKAQYQLEVVGDVRIEGRVDLGDTLLHNTVVGHKSGIALISGEGNAFFGSEAGAMSQTASANSFFGQRAGHDNIDGNSNSFFGNASGLSNQSGVNNSYLGTDAGLLNITGSNNAMVGSAAGVRTISSNNSFFGFAAGLENTAGTLNVYIGKHAGLNNSLGSRNVIIGADAGDAITSGSNNTIIGYKAQSSDSTSNNQIVIGYRADGQGNNTVTLGNEFISTVYMGEDGMASVVSSSDIRMKKDIAESNLGLDFINALRPVSYYWKDRSAFPSEFIKGELDSMPTDKTLQHGLVAQEVRNTLDALGVEWQGWHENNESSRQGLTYSALTVPLIKAVQELSEEVVTLRRTLVEYQAAITASTDPE